MTLRNLTAIMIVLLLISEKCSAFPKDLTSHLFLDSSYTASFPIFTASKTLKDVQEVKFLNDKILISSRNAIYVIDKNAMTRQSGEIKFEQIVQWKPQDQDVKNCERKTGSYRACQNYIRMVEPTTSNLILLCGTNAKSPLCREYQWTGSSFNGSVQNLSMRGHWKIPYDDQPSLAYIYSEGYMFSATRIDFNGFEAAITRTVADVKVSQIQVTIRSGAHGGAVSSVLTTNRKASPFSNPHFAKMIDNGEKIFIFFREEAIGATESTDKEVYTRVAQVCKNDTGGSTNVLRGEWTSLFKARLNCSVPGDRPFYINEIQDITEPVMLNGQMTLFATMTTPDNSIAGSAVCAFTLQDITATLAGELKKDACMTSNVVGGQVSHHSTCRSKTDPPLSDRNLNYIRRHPLISRSVPAVGMMPLFLSTQSRERFTALDVETDVPTAGGFNVTFMYIGTQTGKLLKVLINQSALNYPKSAAFSEEMDVYQHTACFRNESTIEASLNFQGTTNIDKTDNRVIKVKILQGSNVILVTFQHCIVSVPKQLCHLHTCESACTQSGNPYCGWNGEKCVALSSFSDQNVYQDLFSQRSYSERCLKRGHSTSSDQESLSMGTTVSILVGLVVTLCLVLLCIIIYVLYKGWKKKQEEKCATTNSGTKYVTSKNGRELVSVVPSSPTAVPL